jgi:hypothetical protein
MLGRTHTADRVELRAYREGASMAWTLTRGLAEIVAEELRQTGWTVSFGEPAGHGN